MNVSYGTISVLEIGAAVFMGVLLLGSVLGRQYREARDRLLLALMLLNSIMLLCDAPIWHLYGQPSMEHVALLKQLSLLVDILSFVTVALYARYLTACVAVKAAVTKRFAHTMLILSMLGAAVCTVGLFTNTYLWFDAAGIMHYGVLYPYLILYSFILLMVATAYPLCHAKALGTGNAVLLASYSLIVLLAVPLQMQLEAAPILLTFTLTLTLIYAVAHGEMGVRVTAQKEQLLRTQLEAEQARISVMLSQIQPHFMFNVLNTIYHLCGMDASRAQQAVGDFSEYMRGSINALRRSEPVPFEVELHNVQCYLDLEKLRFEEELNVVYDIQTMAFMLPMLTLQPMVENAVRHGLCKKPGGGTLRIATQETDAAFEITVTDDGVGFDPDAQPDNDGREHIGIPATRLRLREMCGGTLDITSRPGTGTQAVIHIPKGYAEEEQA
ncbi:MAG: sensor histidine kinase [Aristaeellaceae bacterium]